MKLSTILKTLDPKANVLIKRNEKMISEYDRKVVGNHYAENWLKAIAESGIDPDVSVVGSIYIDDTYDDYIQYNITVDLPNNVLCHRFDVSANYCALAMAIS